MWKKIQPLAEAEGSILENSKISSRFQILGAKP